MEINKSYPCDARNYRRGRRDTIKYIVIHYVGATGSALANVKYYGSSNVGASAHFYVGHASEEGAVYQSVDPKDCAWHCGHDPGGRYYHPECRNDNAIGIELCCHKDSHRDWYFDSVTVQKAAELTRALMREYNIDVSNVLRHYDVTHKCCPAPFVLNTGAWEAFKNSLKEENIMPLTVQKLDEVYVQTIDDPLSLGFHIFDAKKREIGVPNYFNAGFFAKNADGSTIPIGNLADSGWIFSQSKDNADWINVAKKKLTTIYTTNAGGCGMVRTDDLSTILDLRTAISGIPIARGGRQVTMDEIKAEGYDGSELYETWHGFLGLRGGIPVYVAAKCGYESMFWILRALGITDAIKLDGGGSFVLHNGVEIVGTNENRRINNCGMWEG